MLMDPAAEPMLEFIEIAAGASAATLQFSGAVDEATRALEVLCFWAEILDDDAATRAERGSGVIHCLVEVAYVMQRTGKKNGVEQLANSGWPRQHFGGSARRPGRFNGLWIAVDRSYAQALSCELVRELS